MGSKANSNVLFLSCSASFVYDPAMKMSLKRRRLKKFLKTCLRWMTQPIFIHRNIIFFSLQYASKIMFKKIPQFSFNRMQKSLHCPWGLRSLYILFVIWILTFSQRLIEEAYKRLFYFASKLTRTSGGSSQKAQLNTSMEKV